MYKTQFDKSYSGTSGEENHEPSKTVPDMNIAVRTLLERHSRGMSVDVVERIPNYSETEIPRFDDITDREQWAKDLRMRRANLEAELEAFENEQRERSNAKEKTPETGGKQLRIDEEAEKADKAEDSTIQS